MENQNVILKNKKLKKEEKRKLKKEELKQSIMKYTINDCFDITKFRVEREKDYMLIPHYFGSVSECMEELHLVKVVSGTVKEGNNLTLKDALAFDQIKSLREKGLTYEEIAKKYGVSKVLVSKMFRVLESKAKEN